MRVYCYIIEEVDGVLRRRLEDFKDIENVFDACDWCNQYNVDSARLNNAEFLRVAELEDRRDIA